MVKSPEFPTALHPQTAQTEFININAAFIFFGKGCIFNMYKNVFQYLFDMPNSRGLGTVLLTKRESVCILRL